MEMFHVTDLCSISYKIHLKLVNKDNKSLCIDVYRRMRSGGTFCELKVKQPPLIISERIDSVAKELITTLHRGDIPSVHRFIRENFTGYIMNRLEEFVTNSTIDTFKRVFSISMSKGFNKYITIQLFMCNNEDIDIDVTQKESRKTTYLMSGHIKLTRNINVYLNGLSRVAFSNMETIQKNVTAFLKELSTYVMGFIEVHPVFVKVLVNGDLQKVFEKYKPNVLNRVSSYNVRSEIVEKLLTTGIPVVTELSKQSYPASICFDAPFILRLLAERMEVSK